MDLRKIAVLFCDQDNPFWLETIRMYREFLPVHGFYGDFLFPEDPRDGLCQAELMERHLTADYDGMIINPLTAENLLPPLESSSRKFPVFDVGPKCDQEMVAGISGYTPLQAADFEEQGRMCTEAILGNCDGPLGCIGGPIDTRQSRMRIEGAVKTARQRGLTVLDVEWSDFTREGGRRAMKKLIPLKPGAIFCANDLMALGAIETAAEKGVEIPVGGVDLIPEALSAIEEGSLTASVGLDPAELVDEILKSIGLFLRYKRLPTGTLTNNILKTR